MKENAFWSSMVLTLCLVCISSPAFGQHGVFEKTVDWPQIGDFKLEGEVSVSGDEYTVKGNGNNIGSNTDSLEEGGDEGFFVYKELEGSHSLQARIAWIDTWDTSEVGVMIRQSPEQPGSNYFQIETNQWGAQTHANFRNRLGVGGTSGEQLFTPDGAPVEDPGDGLWIRVTRIEPIDFFYCEYSLDGTEWVFGYSMTQAWDSETAAYGIAIAGGQDDDWLVEAKATDVAFSTPPPITVRSLSQAAFSAGDTVEVTIDVINSGDSPRDITIEETVPLGWSVSDVSDGGSESGGTITWNLTSVPAGTTQVTYNVTAPGSPDDEAFWSGGVGESNVKTLGKAGLLFSEGSGERVSDGILVLYTFDAGQGDTVYDVSGVGEPLNLKMRDPDRVEWEDGFVRVTAPTIIQSEELALKIFNACVESDEITIEAWITPDNVDQNGTARIVTMSDNVLGTRDFTLGQGQYGQGGDRWQIRLGTDINPSGDQPRTVVTERGTLEPVLTHIVFTRNIEWATTFYKNGQILFEGWQDGFLTSWMEFYFALANEINGSREWLGEYHVVAIYGRALTDDEVGQNFAAGPAITIQTDVADWSLF